MERQDLSQMALRRFKAHKRPVEGEEGTAAGDATPVGEANGNEPAETAATEKPTAKKQKK